MKSKFLKFILIPTLVVAVIATAACLWAAAGNEEGNEPAANSENSVVIGDVNGDGKVTLGDLVTLRKHILDANVAVDMIGADANEDGKVNSADILYLNRYFAGYNYDSEDPNYNPDVSDFATNHTDIVKLSNSLANGVNVYYTDSKLAQLTVKNQNMTLRYGVKNGSNSMYVESLANKDGAAYVQNTMDIVLNMTDGTKYYASQSATGTDAELRLYRYGYYFYETRIEGQNFGSSAPAGLSLQRTFYTYSDKMHHMVQLSTSAEVTDVKSVDMVTTVNNVNGVVVKEIGKDPQNNFTGVTWANVEYVGFYVNNVGVIGFILPVYDADVYENNRHPGVGTLSVSGSGSTYTVTQTKAVANNTLAVSEARTLNANDFYMGMRIYTDENTTFDEFIKQATIERNPLTSENIKVDTGYDNSEYVAYDPIRGSYVFTLTGSGFTKSYYLYPNRQFRVAFSVEGDEYDRQMYFMTRMSDNGCLESAALLGEGDMLLPVPIEVCKNFVDGNDNIFNLDDEKYSETYFPMTVKPGESKNYSIVHLYQNWGKYPLKQISSIEYHTPFYHLSTGVTETNCIVPFREAGPGLPDHRAMSAPFWATSPQHTNGGSHVFLHYDSTSKLDVLSYTTSAKIDSYGPTYADIELGYLSSDGKVKATYHHMEFPQTDENRAFYTLEYKFLDKVTFSDFKTDFKFYRCGANSTGKYTQIEYLGSKNESETAVPVSSGNQGYVLGDDSPYFAMYNMVDKDGKPHTDYVNIAFLIKDAEIIQGGKSINPGFYINNYIVDGSSSVSLSLNLTNTTFYANDTITIHAIIMPWGSQESDYSKGATNVRQVREDSILNPFTATAVTNATVISEANDWLPKIKTDNGVDAEFKVSGGNNNCVVRVYGFDLLTTPAIEEYVDGEWVKYDVNSASAPDARGYGYEYDGYMVHYDEDGSYSYSFVIPMNNGAERRFRVIADKLFTPLPEVEHTPEYSVKTEGDPLNLYIDADELYNLRDESLYTDFSNIELMDEDGLKFVRYYGLKGATEGFTIPFDRAYKGYADFGSTGQYAVFKYRVETPTTTTDLNSIQIFTSTKNTAAVDNNEAYSYQNIEQDGEWHVVIIDLSKAIGNPSVHFLPDGEGNYNAKYFRIDLFNQKFTDNNMYIDLAYVGLCDNLDAIYELNSDMNDLTMVVDQSTTKVVYPTVGTWQVTFQEILVNGTKIGSDGRNTEALNVAYYSRVLKTPQSFGLNVRCFVNGGVKEYKYRVIGENKTTDFTSLGAGTTITTSRSDYNTWLNMATSYGIKDPASALTGVNLGTKYFDLAGFEGEAVTIELVAVTNSGVEMVIANVGVTVPNS